MKMFKKVIYCLFLLPLLFASCAEEDTVPGVDPEPVGGSGDGGEVIGFYVLNEGNMGQNKCTLDYFDYTTETYYRNIYAENNPDVVMELGDAGNDIAVHNGRLFIVVNGSHKVEVLDAYTAKRQGSVDVSSPRYLAFRGDSVFVSSFVGGDGVNGSVVCFDARTLNVLGTCGVGAGPEEMVVADSLLYVANSQNYGAQVFDNTISVVNMNTMQQVGSIPVATNLHHLRLDDFGNMWASARGNYADEGSSLTRLAKDEDGKYAVAEKLPYGCENLALGNGMLYFYSSSYDANWNPTYGFDYLEPTATGYNDFNANFITDGTASEIATPYALAVQPSNGDIFITDARNYTSSGELRCYSPNGELKWKAETGDIPGHIAFLRKSSIH